MKKLKGFTLGLFIAIGAGLAAFSTELDNQKKERKITDLEERVGLLEKNVKENMKESD